MLADVGFCSELERARAAELVDYPAVWRLKLRVLDLAPRLPTGDAARP
jgi:hypothetical protein